MIRKAHFSPNIFGVLTSGIMKGGGWSSCIEEVRSEYGNFVDKSLVKRLLRENDMKIDFKKQDLRMLT
jgi:hypothetical protein